VTGEEGEAGRRQQARVTVTDGAEAFALASSSCVACAARYCRVTEPRPNRQALCSSRLFVPSGPLPPGTPSTSIRTSSTSLPSGKLRREMNW
jgi:hypothetical protein